MVVAATTGVEAAREGTEVQALEGATGAATRQDTPLFQAAGAVEQNGQQGQQLQRYKGTKVGSNNSRGIRVGNAQQ